MGLGLRNRACSTLGLEGLGQLAVTGRESQQSVLGQIKL